MKKSVLLFLVYAFFAAFLMSACTEQQMQQAREAGVDLNMEAIRTGGLQSESVEPDGLSRSEIGSSSEPAIKIMEEAAREQEAAGAGDESEAPHSAGAGRIDDTMAAQDALDKEADSALDEMLDNIEELPEQASGLDAIADLTGDTGSGTDSREAAAETPAEADVDRSADENNGDSGAPTEQENVESRAEETAENTEAETGSEQSAAPTPPPAPAAGGGRLIAIDAGHQSKGNSEKEPIGPGASQTKAKVAGGTRGVATGKPEYQLTLEVALKLQQALQARGYSVLMIRTGNDVNISNAERAQMANNAGAAAFIRIHANGSDNPAVNGALTMCQSSSNPYNGNLASQSYKLSSCVLDGLVARCGCKKSGISQTDTMSGINWCQVPVTIVEMGFMTNPDEDTRMSTEDYQQKLAEGMADGIDAYFR